MDVSAGFYIAIATQRGGLWVVGYPGFRVKYDGMAVAERAAAVLFTVPDGRWPSVGAGAERARRAAQGVRAVAGFVLGAAAVHPVVGRSLWAAGR